MQTRLLAFLAQTQHAICTEKPEPRPGSTWVASRSVNYGHGLARLTLGFRELDGKVSTLGSVLLQSFKLADGTLCLKAHLAWQESDAEFTFPIYAKPHLEWEGEAAHLATAWLSGPPAKVSPIVHEPVVSASAHEPEMLAAG